MKNSVLVSVSIIIFYNLIFTPISLCQNLIPNYGFESYDTCPDQQTEITYAINWHSTENTPDYFNECNNPSNVVGVPYNSFGYQDAHSGCAYGGLIAVNSHDGNYREYMQCQLLTTLIQNQKYYFSYNINLCNSVNGRCSGTNKFGFKLSTQSFSYTTDGSPATDNTATFYSDSIITDTLNWTTIRGSFIADSAYNYISFGNFFDSLNTQYIILTGSPFVVSYYYIDDVCLSADSMTCVSVSDTCRSSPVSGVVDEDNKNSILVFPNPFFNQLSVEMINDETFEIIVYDITSRKILNRHFKKQTTINTEIFSPGVYFYEIRNVRDGSGGIIKAGKVVKE